MTNDNDQRDIEKDLGERVGSMTEALEVLKAFADGFATTFKHLFRKPITEQYPEYKRPLPERTRARIILTRDPDGGERCVACYLCWRGTVCGLLLVLGSVSGELHLHAIGRERGRQTLCRLVSHQLWPMYLLRFM